LLEFILETGDVPATFASPDLLGLIAYKPSKGIDAGVMILRHLSFSRGVGFRVHSGVA
jgi:hypothetical protein